MKTKKDIKTKLTPLQYHVTQENGTERPFDNEFWNHNEDGLYVDIISGEPLFSSLDKFESSCGWPSFAKPVSKLETKVDKTFSMVRTEVRSKEANSHLGHLFTDGPVELGGYRYCINSAALRFIPKKDMKKEGYEAYLNLFDNK